MLEIQEYVDIKDYSTMKIGGQFRYFVKISSVEELNYFYAIAQNKLEYKNIPVFILGGGSNIIFSDGIINVIALKIEIKGFEIVPVRHHESSASLPLGSPQGADGKETNEFVDIKVGGGEIWDEIVKKTVDMNLMGLESLSAIPGTVGATPVQNVGAYGSEVKDIITEVEVFDIKEKTIKTLSNEDCKFGYRDSIFKNEAKGKYVITAVTYRLRKIDITSPEILFERSSDEGGRGARPFQKEFQASSSSSLSYPGVKKYFEEKMIENPNLKQIREAIINIRKEKLPNPKEIPNVGSFFKNPIVSKEVADKILVDFPNAKFFPVNVNTTKIPAGWLIENAGLKGKSFGNISVYNKNALVLINNGGAIKEDLEKAKTEIIKIVEDKFGITLEQEPEII
jgi:UDP-N-acetylmuramate dehydrogenase